MAEKDEIKNVMERIEQHLRQGPSEADQALKELAKLLETGIHDPRVLVYQAVAHHYAGKTQDALEYARTALTISQNIAEEAKMLVEKLSAKK